MSATSYPYRGRAIMKYKPPPQPGHSAEQTAQQFAFQKGDTITVTGQADDEGDWLEGEKDGVKGVFPAGFVEPLGEEEKLSSAAPVDAEPIAAPAAATAAETPASLAPGTVEATPSDPTNVVEKQDTEPTAHVEQESHVREPEPAVKEPTLADVTPEPVESSSTRGAEPDSEPKSAPSAPARAASAESDQSTTKSAPPPPAKKPNALASRIAAFNAAASAQAAEPPVPRPKPKQWSRPSAPPAAAAATALPPKSPTSPSTVRSSLPHAPADHVHAPGATTLSEPKAGDALGGERREFSAEDAQESISRGGGSLRDRIKALQGGGAGGMGARVDPSAKPWKKHASTDDSTDADAGATESAASTSTEVDTKEVSEPETTEAVEPIDLKHPEENLRNTVVLDSPPAIEHRTAEEPQSDIPGFEPAEEDEDEAHGEASQAETAGTPPIAVTSAATTCEPVEAETASSIDENRSSAEETGERAAIAEPVAGLGGQRVGLPMPALPKRAAGPRARKAKSPAAASPASTSADPMESGETSSAPASAAAPATDAVVTSPTDGAQRGEEQAPPRQNDVFASMGGANRLLADDEDNEETERPKAPIDDDDFETPAAPPPTQSARPVAPSPQRSFEEPDLEEGEEEINVAQYGSNDDAHQRTIAEEAVEALPSSEEPTVEEEAPLSPTSGRPPLPPPFVRQATEPAAKSDAEEDKEAPVVPAARHPPIPTHQPPPDQESITTAAEDAYLEKMPDILTPPEEAADESTAAPELNAPTTETIAQTRHEAGHQPAEMAKPTFGKVEGTATPAVERSPPLLAQSTVAGLAGQLGKQSVEGAGHQAAKHTGEDKAAEEGAQEEEEEEEEEEDPEIARRRALAARMAKLGGRGPLMGGPMLGFGGLPPKKPTKKKSTAEDVDHAAQAPVPRVESQGTSQLSIHPPIPCSMADISYCGLSRRS